MNRLIMLFVFLLALVGVELYLYFVFRVYFAKKNNKRKVFSIVWFLIPVLLVISTLIGDGWGRSGKILIQNITMIWFFALFITAVLVGLADIIRLTVNIISKPPTEEVSLGRRKSIALIGAIIAAVPLSSMLFGLFKTAYDFKVHRIALKFPNLPQSFNGLKIVQLSDIHTGSFRKDDELQEAVKLVLDQKPDIIFFTGDIVNNKTEEALPFVDALKKLQAPLGVFSTLGNHDYGDYEQWPSIQHKLDNMQAMYQLHKDLGWRLLNNENSVLEVNGEKIAIVGVENWGKSPRFPKHGNVKKANQGLDDIPFKILLSHDPSHWDAVVLPEHKDMDLMLSGHTHGFQFGIEIPGFKWSPSQWLYKQWAGLYQSGNQYLYVNRGLGCLGYSGRVGIRPEITFFELFQE